MNTPRVSRSLWTCVPTVNLCDCTCILRFWVQCKWIMAETERGTELTTVVLDGDVIGQELVLASHTNEQWASSPVGRVGKRKCGWVGRQEGIKVCRHTTLPETHSVTWCCHKSESWGNLTSYPTALFRGTLMFWSLFIPQTTVRRSWNILLQCKSLSDCMICNIKQVKLTFAPDHPHQPLRNWV